MIKMKLQTPEERAVSVLSAMAAEPETRAASGRYVRARDSRPGVRLWATTQQRYQQDLVGIQFYGRGRGEGEALAPLLERHGFMQRTPQAGQLTFAKPVGYSSDGGIDRSTVAEVRKEIDTLLETPSASTAASRSSFRDFMLASPLSDADLATPVRTGGWRGEEV
jgi:hypothetical protein